MVHNQWNDYSMYGKKNERFPFLFKKDTAIVKCTWIFVLSKKILS